MSLLFNLLSYSSITSPKFCSQKQQRSCSSIGRFSAPNELNKDRFTASTKSLQKYNSSTINQQIDHKTRILHKLSHKIAIKCRKNYYTFFVLLESLKKKNLYLQQNGQINSNIPQRLNVSQKSNLKIKYENIETGFNKIATVYQLKFIKQYQKNIKAQGFKNIFYAGKYRESLNKIIAIQQKISKKIYFKIFTNKIHDIQILVSKIDIFCMTLNSIFLNNKNGLAFSLNQKVFAKVVKKIYESNSSHIKNSLYQCKQLNQQTPKKVSLKKNFVQREEQKTDKKQYEKKNKNQLIFLDCEQKFVCKKPLSPIDLKLQKKQALQLTKNETIFKNVKISQKFIQQSYDQIYSTQAESKICNRLPIDRIYQNISDQYDKQIFMNRSKNYQNLQISNVSLISKKNYQEKKYRQQGPYFSIYGSTSQLKSESSVLSLLDYQSTKNNDSLFGSQAVNFKNMLIKQRQSLKSENRKNYNKSNQQPINQVCFKKQKLSLTKNQQKQQKIERNKHKINQTFMNYQKQSEKIFKQSQFYLEDHIIGKKSKIEQNNYFNKDQNFINYYTSRDQTQSIHPTRDNNVHTNCDMNQSQKKQAKPVKHKNFIKLLNSSRN